MFARLCALLSLLLGAGCVSVTVGESQSNPVEVNGLLDAYVTADALTPYDGRILHMGILTDTPHRGELISFDLWPLLGFGVGVAGARLRVLPLEVGVGALFYEPQPPRRHKDRTRTVVHETEEPAADEPAPEEAGVEDPAGSAPKE